MLEDRNPRPTRIPRLTRLQQLSSLNRHLSTLTMNSSPHISSSLRNPPHATPSSGKRPITTPALPRYSTGCLSQRPEHNASLYGEPLPPALLLSPHQFNMPDTDFYKDYLQCVPHPLPIPPHLPTLTNPQHPPPHPRLQRPHAPHRPRIPRLPREHSLRRRLPTHAPGARPARLRGRRVAERPRAV